jgi:hypothetical protein
LSTEKVSQQLPIDSIYEYIVKEKFRYEVNLNIEQNFLLIADEVRVFVGLLLLTDYHKLLSERLYLSEVKDLDLQRVRKLC